MRDGLGMKEVLGDSEDSEKSFYYYPTVFSGSMDVTKAKVIAGTWCYTFHFNMNIQKAPAPR